MKKKLLLIALPTLMALSACGSRPAEPAEKEQIPDIVETTTAQEEVFGDAKQAQGPAVRKMDVVDTKPRYKVGYQIHFDEGEVVDDEPDSDDKISIRFIAAIDATYSKMLWHRGLTSPGGTEKLTFSSNSSAAGYPELVSTVVYETLANGNEDEMTANQGAYADYTGFIVYSITDIPYMNYMNYYLGVSLDLIPSAGETVYTDFYAIKVEKNGSASAHSFTFSHDKTGFFMAGTVKGASGTVNDDGKNRGGNIASFTGDLNANDKLVVVQKESNMFKVWAGSQLGDTDADVVNENGLLKVMNTAKYVFYLDDKNGVYHTKYGVYTGTYLRGTAGGGWGNNEGDIGITNAYRFVTDPDNKAVLLGVSLTAGTDDAGLFKISDQNWSHQWGYTQCKDGGDFWSPNGGSSIVIGGAASNFEGSDGNIRCKVGGTYNIYLTNNWFISVELAA